MGVVLLHEGFHLDSTGKFGHEKLARAAKGNFKPVPESPEATDRAASAAFQQKLEDACGEKKTK